MPQAREFKLSAPSYYITVAPLSSEAPIFLKTNINSGMTFSLVTFGTYFKFFFYELKAEWWFVPHCSSLLYSERDKKVKSYQLGIILVKKLVYVKQVKR